MLRMAPLFLSSWFHQVWIVQQEQIEKREMPWQEALHFSPQLWLPMLRKGALTRKQVPEEACKYGKGIGEVSFEKNF